MKAGKVLARLDPTLATANTTSVVNHIARQQLQALRFQAELNNTPMLPQAGDDRELYSQVQRQYLAHRQAFMDSLAQEQLLLNKAQYEHQSANNILAKLEETLPTYDKTTEAFQKLEQQGFVANLATAERQCQAVEKAKDLEAQRSVVAALTATISAQQKRISQLQSTYQSELQKELAEVSVRIAQIQPSLDKSVYHAGLLELKAPQSGVVKDLAVTTMLEAVVQTGTALLRLVPDNKPLHADVQIKNEDVGFVQVGQRAQLQLAAYPFQKYGMLTGRVIHIGADATEASSSTASRQSTSSTAGEETMVMSRHKARVQLDAQILKGP